MFVNCRGEGPEPELSVWIEPMPMQNEEPFLRKAFNMENPSESNTPSITSKYVRQERFTLINIINNDL